MKGEGGEGAMKGQRGGAWKGEEGGREGGQRPMFRGRQPRATQSRGDRTDGGGDHRRRAGLERIRSEETPPTCEWPSLQLDEDPMTLRHCDSPRFVR